MKKSEARSFAKSNIADAFIQGCSHHINNTTNNDYKKFLIEQIAILNKKLKDNNWTTFAVPAYVPSAPAGGGTPTANDQRIIQEIERSTKIIDDMDQIVAQIQVYDSIVWKTELNAIIRTINELEAGNAESDKNIRKNKLGPLVSTIIERVNKVQTDEVYKPMLAKLEKDILEFRMKIEYLKVSGALGRFPRLALLNNWYVFFFEGWDNKIKKLKDLNTQLSAIPSFLTPAKNNMINTMTTIMNDLADPASTTTNLTDLKRFFGIQKAQTTKKGEIDSEKLRKAIASSFNKENLLHVKMFEIFKLEDAKILINEEFAIFKDLKATTTAMNEFLKTRVS